MIREIQEFFVINLERLKKKIGTIVSENGFHFIFKIKIECFTNFGLIEPQFGEIPCGFIADYCFLC